MLYVGISTQNIACSQRARESERKRDRQTDRQTDKEREKSKTERARESKKENKHVRHILCTHKTVQDATWNGTSHPKICLCEPFNQRIILYLRDIHNTQSNHIFTQSLSLWSYFTQLTELRAAVAS